MKELVSKKTDTSTQTSSNPPVAERSESPPVLESSNQERLDSLGDCGYQVQEGDTLWGIAETFTGDGMGWLDLYDRNQGVVGENPDLILPDQVLDLCEQTVLQGEDEAVVEEAVEAVEGGAEVEEVVEEVAEEQEPEAFVDVATGMFGTLAGDDGYLSSADLDAAMTNPDLTLEQSAALVTMRRLQDDLEELSNDEWFDENSGITMADLERYRDTGELPGSEFTPDDWYAHHRGRMEGYSQELFANGTPSVDAIHQGGIGDCYFLAALGSAVQQDPQAVADMVVPEEDGTYTVTFPNGESANVAAPTLAEIETYGRSGEDGMWVSLFERAAGATRDSDAVIPAEELDGGSLAGRAGTDFFSGDGTSNVDMLGLTGNDTTRDRMESAFTDGRVVIAGINNDFFSDNREGLPDAHAYSILGYDRDSDTVTVRNPHGHGEQVDENGDPIDGDDDGTFTLTMDEFNRLFSSVSYADAAFAEE